MIWVYYFRYRGCFFSQRLSFVLVQVYCWPIWVCSTY